MNTLRETTNRNDKESGEPQKGDGRCCCGVEIWRPQVNQGFGVAGTRKMVERKPH